MIIICINNRGEIAMTATEATTAIDLLRRAGLAPTRRRVTVAALAFGGPTVTTNPEELRERAMDHGICLSREGAAEALAELHGAGLLPRFITAPARPSGDMRQSARLLSAMGNPHRLAVLRELAKGERCVGQLRQAAGIQPSALSQHLARLRTDGLVNTRRSSRHILYSLAGDTVAAVLRSLGH